MLKLVPLRWLVLPRENPSFSCNKALLSRCRVLALQAIDSAAGATLLARVASHPDGLPDFACDDDARELLVCLGGGDGRRILLLAEESWALSQPNSISADIVKRVAAGTMAGHDRAGESHYDVASGIY